MTIVIIFSLLSGAKVIKNASPKKQNKIQVSAIARHPSRWWDWCAPDDQKEETEKLWG